MMSATDSEGTSLRKRAEALGELTGVSFDQIARAIGITSARGLYNSSIHPNAQKRFDEFEDLLKYVPGETKEERRAQLFDSSKGASIFRKFNDATVRDQRIQHTIPVNERLGL